MKSVKKKFIAVLMIAVVFFGISNVTFAAVMTDVELDKAIETFKSNLQKEAAEEGGIEDGIFDIRRENNKIIVSSEGEELEFMYDFSTECKFYIDMEFTKEVSFDEAQTETENSSIPMMGFMIIASNKGCKSLDSLAYVFFSLLSELESGVELTTEDSNMNGLEYAKKLYQETISVDKELFKTDLEMISETTDKIVLRSSFVVKEDGDFTQINGIWDTLFPEENEEENDINNNTNQNNSNQNNTNANQNNTNINKDNENKNNTNKNNENQKELPKAGINIKQLEILKITASILVVAIMLVGGSLFAKKSK